MSSSEDFFNLLQMVFQAEAVQIEVECTEEARVRKAIAKCKNERGLSEWRYFKLRYKLSPSSSPNRCTLEITKYKVVKTALLHG